MKSLRAELFNGRNEAAEKHVIEIDESFATVFSIFQPSTTLQVKSLTL